MFDIKKGAPVNQETPFLRNHWVKMSSFFQPVTGTLQIAVALNEYGLLNSVCSINGTSCKKNLEFIMVPR
jgi:hypothetical protein